MLFLRQRLTEETRRAAEATRETEGPLADLTEEKEEDSKVVRLSLRSSLQLQEFARLLRQSRLLLRK